MTSAEFRAPQHPQLRGGGAQNSKKWKVFFSYSLNVEIGPTRKSEPKLLLSGCIAGLTIGRKKDLVTVAQGH